MAFRMTRPTIQGTEYHKASVLKAKAETVDQTRTAADPTLVAAGSELGSSYIPKAIDFTIKPTEIKIPEGDGGEKKPREKEKQTDNAFNDVNKDGNVLSKSGKVIGKGVVNGVGVLIGAGGQILNAAGDILEGTVNAAGEVVDLAGNVIGGVFGGVDKVLKGIDQKIKDAGNKYKVKQDEKAELIKKGIQENSIKLDPKTIKQLPTNAAKEELFKATGSAANYSYQQGRFEKAAQEFGYDISTPEGYKEAEDVMEYNDRTDTWTNPRISVGKVANNNAETQAQIDAREALKLQKAKDKVIADQIIKDKAIADQIIKNKKIEEVEAQNKAIDLRNAERKAAMQFFDIPEDGKLYSDKLEEYRDMRILQAENEAKYKLNPIEIEEQNDREWNEAPPGQETVSNRSDLQKGGKFRDVDSNTIPDLIQKPTQVKQDVKPITTTTSQTTQNVATTKPKLSDFKDGKNAFGGHMSKNQAYDEAMKKWRKQNPNPIQMRDDAIYKNAIKDGIVQKNMIKSGYKPLD